VVSKKKFKLITFSNTLATGSMFLNKSKHQGVLVPQIVNFIFQLHHLLLLHSLFCFLIESCPLKIIAQIVINLTGTP